MDQKLANKLFEEGAFLFLLDVPIGTEVGIDFNSWKTGEKFKGIKMIPPGIHFIYYRQLLCSKKVCLPPDSIFFTISVKRKLWFVDGTQRWKTSSTIAVRKRKKISTWVHIHMTPGKNGSHSALMWLRKWNLFSKRFHQSFPEGSSAMDITKYSIDTSYILEQMLSRWERSNDMLAEFQMAFLSFLIGQNMSVRFLFDCAGEILMNNPSLISELIGDLYFQLQEVTPDFFVDIISSENFLIQTLRVLFENIIENDAVDIQLKRRAVHLKQYVTQRFQWDFDVEPDDEAPVLVKMDGDFKSGSTVAVSH
uniref:Protein AAR2 homolog n=1 Tax=Daphnia galeata TaxID=27404 RepID=A0A8J2SA50_9CRUS|nr:unnamed protein product [Daphnia galeata]